MASELNLEDRMQLAIKALLSCQACQESTDKTSLDERQYISLQRSVSVRSKAEVIITHARNTSDACETHALSVEKSIASLALWFCWQWHHLISKESSPPV